MSRVLLTTGPGVHAFSGGEQAFSEMVHKNFGERSSQHLPVFSLFLFLFSG